MYSSSSSIGYPDPKCSIFQSFDQNLFLAKKKFLCLPFQFRAPQLRMFFCFLLGFFILFLIYTDVLASFFIFFADSVAFALFLSSIQFQDLAQGL